MYSESRTRGHIVVEPLYATRVETWLLFRRTQRFRAPASRAAEPDHRFSLGFQTLVQDEIVRCTGCHSAKFEHYNLTKRCAVLFMIEKVVFLRHSKELKRNFKSSLAANENGHPVQISDATSTCASDPAARDSVVPVVSNGMANQKSMVQLSFHRNPESIDIYPGVETSIVRILQSDSVRLDYGKWQSLVLHDMFCRGFHRSSHDRYIFRCSIVLLLRLAIETTDNFNLLLISTLNIYRAQ